MYRVICLFVIISAFLVLGWGFQEHNALSAPLKDQKATKTVIKKSAPKKPVAKKIVKKLKLQKPAPKKPVAKKIVKKLKLQKPLALNTEEEATPVIIPPLPLLDTPSQDQDKDKERQPEITIPPSLISPPPLRESESMPPPLMTPAATSTPATSDHAQTPPDTANASSTKPFIVVVETSPDAVLTHNGTFSWTNTRRTENSTSTALLRLPELDTIAEERLKDMFAKQYFDHVSPKGESASTVAKIINFQYLSIGENIALGNFKDDRVLVDAWMKSPGHRANILRPRYTHLGIAVGKGAFESKEQWIGVQIFGTPRSICPSVDENMKLDIQRKQETVRGWAATLQQMKEKLNALNPQTQEEADAYNKIVNEHNALLEQIRSLDALTKNLVNQYNAQVLAANTCIKSVE